jgi:hypothetical protein
MAIVYSIACFAFIDIQIYKKVPLVHNDIYCYCSLSLLNMHLYILIYAGLPNFRLLSVDMNCKKGFTDQKPTYESLSTIKTVID